MSSKQLKILALISMFFDHFIRIFPLSDAMAPIADWVSSIGQENLSVWIMSWIPHLLIYFGRVAAPVFMFCIVEGFLHTCNIKKYMLRIFSVPLVAQIPYILFNLAESRIYGIAGDWKEVPFNILFTLCLGLISLWGYSECEKKGHGILGVGIFLVAGVLARLLRFEGSEGYILMIFMFYVLRNRPAWQKALIFIPVLALARYRLIAYTFKYSALLRTCILNVIGPYLGILAICCYSGEKGNTGKRFQRFVYAFYPVHLLALAIVGYLRTPLI
ncbi:TraX family protein [Oscillibacter sp.]|uniref:TraX family protein n=1 Tax=Oscillibacter sp. TaxID=1945593 RepID=UPI002897BFC9|nr:TraX family protein [Oscillibacter sp.]